MIKHRLRHKSKISERINMVLYQRDLWWELFLITLKMKI